MVGVSGRVPTAFGYYLWYEAMAGVSTVTASLLFVLSVVFTFVNAAIFLHEAMTRKLSWAAPWSLPLSFFRL